MKYYIVQCEGTFVEGRLERALRGQDLKFYITDKDLMTELGTLNKTIDQWEKNYSGVLGELDKALTRLGRVSALVSSEDWPAVEQMGRTHTPVKNEHLLDLFDILADEDSPVEGRRQCPNDWHNNHKPGSKCPECKERCDDLMVRCPAAHADRVVEGQHPVWCESCGHNHWPPAHDASVVERQEPK